MSEVIPPEEMLGMFGGPKGYVNSGRNWLRYFREVCDLEPDKSVLDVGCGVGRMVIALTDYLTGPYEGLDVAPERIRWCQQNITPRWPNFRFQVASVFNAASSPDGAGRAGDYVFPYADSQFDFIWLISVFTHMLPDGVAQYLSEIHRVLRPGGRTVITYRLLSDESMQRVAADEDHAGLPHAHGEYRLASERVPERLVAYDESFVRGLYRRTGLEIDQVRYGGWSGREVSPGNAPGGSSRTWFWRGSAR